MLGDKPLPYYVSNCLEGQINYAIPEEILKELTGRILVSYGQEQAIIQFELMKKQNS